MSKLTHCSILVNVSFVITLNFLGKNVGLIDSTITILDVTLKERTLDVKSFLTLYFFAENLNGLHLFSNQFHRLVPLGLNILMVAHRLAYQSQKQNNH